MIVSWRVLPSLKLTARPLKIGHPNKKLVFQPSVFRCELLVSGRVYGMEGLQYNSIWAFPQMVVPPKHHKMIILVGKPMVVGYHHFRKPPYSKLAANLTGKPGKHPYLAALTCKVYSRPCHLKVDLPTIPKMNLKMWRWKNKRWGRDSCLLQDLFEKSHIYNYNIYIYSFLFFWGGDCY